MSNNECDRAMLKCMYTFMSKNCSNCILNYLEIAMMLLYSTISRPSDLRFILVCKLLDTNLQTRISSLFLYEILTEQLDANTKVGYNKRTVMNLWTIESFGTKI